jgi:type IV pilus assembly protein PilB
MPYPYPSLAKKLLQNNLLTPDRVELALTQSRQTQVSFITYLIQQQWILPKDLAIAIADDFGLPLFDLDTADKKSFPQVVDEKLIQRHHVLPLWQKEKMLFVAVCDPTRQTALDEIKFHTGLTIKCVIVESDKLSQLISSREKQTQDILIENEIEKLTFSIEASLQKEIQAHPEKDTPITRYVNKIILDAITKRASDIHFEPYEKEYRIRYRIDGVLYSVASPPIHLTQRITARIKILAELDISERRIPQDGRFKWTSSEEKMIDLRISSCPTIHGEKIVIRILNGNTTILSVDQMGFELLQKKLFVDAIAKPQGMILVTGPTGSGKTITLYTALAILNTDEINISTIENPVEIYLRGINQVNINAKSGLTFAVAMRAFLRQDPDIIMVGEIRDLETAEIAIKAAQTGHLVLSTLHTNSAAETLMRLVNMGIPSYHLASSISLIIAQRLVRNLCLHCKVEIHIPEAELLREGFRENEMASLKIYKAQGCEFCTQGYQGRIGIFELLPVSESLGAIMMRQQANALDIAKQARAEGMQTLRESGLNKVRAGLTSLEEINRVTKEC